MTLHDAISQATRLGYRVSHDPEYNGFVITTPKRPRRPSETLASWRTEERAWRAAALMAELYG